MALRIAPGTKGLGEILVEAGVITPETRTAALARAEHAHERVGEALVALGAVSPDDILRAVAKQWGVPFLSAEEVPFTLPVLKNLSPKSLRQYEACPVSLEGTTLTVATANPTNPLLVDELRQTLGLQIKLCVAPAEAILAAIERTYGASTALQKIVEGMGPVDEGDREEDITQLRDMAFEAPVVRLVNLLIEEAVTAEASDIHIEPSEESLRVRYRIDGILYDLESPPRRLQAAVTSRIKLMAELNIAERRLPQDGRIRMTLNTRRVDIRVSSIPTIHGESIVMRLLDRSSVFMPFDKLGFSVETATLFDKLINQPNKILLVTGPTGSGKTTTLYTNDAPGAIPRLQDMGVEPYLIASVLSGVLAQRLVRRICQSCRVPDAPDPGDLLAIGVADGHGVELFRGEGCEACRKTGYKGRVGIYELFIITEEVRSLILRKASTGEIRRIAVEQGGMSTLREDSWAKARAGLTTVEEILRVTQED